MNRCGAFWIWKSPAGMEPWQWAEEKQKVQAEGVVYRIETATRTSVYLKRTILTNSKSSKKYPIRNIKCTGKEKQLQELKEGMHVLLEGTALLPKLPGNPGEFNQRIYESSRKIDFYLENPQILGYEERTSDKISWSSRWKETMVQRLEAIYPEQEAGILEAMLAGEKENLTAEIKSAYQAAGISHVIAISGLHISLLGMGIAGILRRLGTPMPVWAAVSTRVLVVYGYLIGQPTTAVRALLMFAILQCGRILGRSYDLLSALAFAGILMLLDNPDLVFDGGCRLSFAAVTGTGWYLGEKKAVWGKIRTDRGQTVKAKVWKLPEAVWLGIQLWMFTLPVMLDTFYQVSAAGIFWNLLVIPLLPVVIISGGMAAGLAGWNEFLGSLAGSPAYGILKCYQWIGEFSEWLPAGVWTPGQPSVSQIAGYYLILILLLLVEKQIAGEEKLWKKVTWFWQMEIISVGIGLLLISSPWQQREQITFLDVGQGDGIVCQTGGKTALIDGGSSSQKKPGAYVILPYLKQQGVTQISAIFLTHTDQDHINGVAEVLEEGKKGWLTVENLFYPVWMEQTSQGEQLLEAARKAGTACRGVGAGDQLQIGNADVKVLYPEKTRKEPKEPNDGSLVLLWREGGISTLFTGDLPETKEKELLPVLSRCEILKAGHHGSATSTSQSFLERVQPVMTVISCGADNPYGHPATETVQRLENAGSKIFYTMKCGAVTVEEKRGRIKWRTFRKEEDPQVAENEKSQYNSHKVAKTGKG